MWFLLFDKRPRTLPRGILTSRPDRRAWRPTRPDSSGDTWARGRGSGAHITPPTSTPDHWYSLCILFFFFLSICPFIFGCLQPSGPVVCSLPAVTVRVCSDGRQRGRLVYCFRPRGAPAVTDGLGLRWVFFFFSLLFQLLGPFCQFFSPREVTSLCEVHGEPRQTARP